MDKFLDQHATWRDKTLSRIMPNHNWVGSPVWISHGTSGVGPKYQAKLIHPPSYHQDDADYGPPRVGEDENLVDGENASHYVYNPEPIEKGVLGHHKPEGRYITIHRYKPDAPGHSVLILNDNGGQHKITGGHPNFYGLRLSGILPDNMYTALAKHRHRQYHNDKDLERIVASAFAPQQTASNEKDRPEARQLVKLPPTHAQALSLARTMRSEMTSRDKESEIDDLTNLSGAKRDWLDHFLKQHPDDIRVVIVGEPRLRETLHDDLKAEHPSMIGQSDKPAVYVFGEVPPNSQKKYRLINYDMPLVDVPYSHFTRLSHHDVLLDTIREKKRLTGSAGEFEDEDE